MRYHCTNFFVSLIFLVISVAEGHCQKKRKLSFRDSLDGKFDVSEFLTHPVGFIPLIQPITEPALGDIGVMVSPIFIKPNKYQSESKYVPPNITSIYATYTANKSFFFGGFHSAHQIELGFKYSLAMGYGSVNLNFYRNLPIIGDSEFEFNFKSYPGFGSILKQIGNSEFYIGLEYLFFKSDVSPKFDGPIPPFVETKDLASTISAPGLVIEYDNRDNIFTPDKGLYVNTSYHINRDWTGSDFNFNDLMITVLKYFPIRDNWISGFRFQSEFQNEGAPFFAKPGIFLRGVPRARYQGNSTYMLETEQRYDFTMRWSAVAFGGLAKAVNENQNFGNAQLVYNYGTGFRYLIARKFKLRVGMDFAWSNDDFGYYITFGTAWNQRN
ncbi:BamA/TamA family outer membrane protein [Galbibacter mesophilus]|uniref:BamA/TamA family outer membrane protein n=1 Tax=Galbibacter mesophilus TaxID=379069 RepID=UPI00191E9E72|nr:BamA/TamA family outer membrane protein [Galbibacter mesophilus]MCM5663431.1 BamA/TamA family outer membrane protein [Galbibacter mesophilus]